MTKEEKTVNTTEPTMTDLMGVVQNLAVSVQDLTEAVQAGFEGVEGRFEGIEKQLDRHEGMLTALVEGQHNIREIINERTNALDTRLSKVQNRVEDIVDVLEKAAPKVPGLDVSQLLYENK